jgi:hypothetical protein
MDQKIRINTPYSKRTIQILGIEENDLYEISKEDYLKKQNILKDAPDELKDQRYELFNNKRLKTIEEARKLRKNLIKDEREKQKLFEKDNLDYLYDINETEPNISRQIKNLIKDEFNYQENLKKNIEKQTKIDENKKRIEDEKKRLIEEKKLRENAMMEIIERNQYNNYSRFKKKQEEIEEKQRERIRRLKLKKYFDLEELKRAGLLLDEKIQNAYDKRKIEYDKIIEKGKEIMRKAEDDKKRKESEKVKEPDIWEKEEVSEKQKKKALLKNLNKEINLEKIAEEQYNSDEKVIKMKEEKDFLIKNKIEDMVLKLKEKEERNIINLKRNSEIEDLKVQNIIAKEKKIEENVRKKKKLKSVAMKNKALFLDLRRGDNAENLRIIENKREYERDKIISKMLDREKKIKEFQQKRKEKSERIKNLSREMTAKKNIILKKVRMELRSGKYRDNINIYSQVLTDIKENL